MKPRYPKLRCFAFSPPGGLLCLAAARYTESFCLSVIIGDDLVPRLSLSNLEVLKQQLVTELEDCHHPKVNSPFWSVFFFLGHWNFFFCFHWKVSNFSAWMLGGDLRSPQELSTTREYSPTAQWTSQQCYICNFPNYNFIIEIDQLKLIELHWIKSNRVRLIRLNEFDWLYFWISSRTRWMKEYEVRPSLVNLCACPDVFYR